MSETKTVNNKNENNQLPPVNVYISAAEGAPGHYVRLGWAVLTPSGELKEKYFHIKSAGRNLDNQSMAAAADAINNLPEDLKKHPVYIHGSGLPQELTENGKSSAKIALRRMLDKSISEPTKRLNKALDNFKSHNDLHFKIVPPQNLFVTGLKEKAKSVELPEIVIKPKLSKKEKARQEKENKTNKEPSKIPPTPAPDKAEAEAEAEAKIKKEQKSEKLDPRQERRLKKQQEDSEIASAVAIFHSHPALAKIFWDKMSQTANQNNTAPSNAAISAPQRKPSAKKVARKKQTKKVVVDLTDKDFIQNHDCLDTTQELKALNGELRRALGNTSPQYRIHLHVKTYNSKVAALVKNPHTLNHRISTFGQQKNQSRGDKAEISEFKKLQVLLCGRGQHSFKDLFYNPTKGTHAISVSNPKLRGKIKKLIESASSKNSFARENNEDEMEDDILPPEYEFDNNSYVEDPAITRTREFYQRNIADNKKPAISKEELKKQKREEQKQKAAAAKNGKTDESDMELPALHIIFNQIQGGEEKPQIEGQLHKEGKPLATKTINIMGRGDDAAITTTKLSLLFQLLNQHHESVHSAPPHRVVLAFEKDEETLSALWPDNLDAYADESFIPPPPTGLNTFGQNFRGQINTRYQVAVLAQDESPKANAG